MPRLLAHRHPPLQPALLQQLPAPIDSGTAYFKGMQQKKKIRIERNRTALCYFARGKTALREKRETAHFKNKTASWRAYTFQVTSKHLLKSNKHNKARAQISAILHYVDKMYGNSWEAKIALDLSRNAQ